MGKVHIGINLESPPERQSFEWSLEKARRWATLRRKPMVHWGRELLSAAGYFHSVSLLRDPLRTKGGGRGGDCDVGPLRHSPLCLARRRTDYCGRRSASAPGRCPDVVTDDGPARPGWGASRSTRC